MGGILSNAQKGSETRLPVQIVVKYRTNIIFETTRSNVLSALNAHGIH